MQRQSQGGDVGEAVDEETQDPEVQHGETVRVACRAQQHCGSEVVDLRTGEVERGDPDQPHSAGIGRGDEERGVRAAFCQLIRGDREDR